MPTYTSANAFSKRKFDFIVVGGGTAGIAVASRLAERPELQIGLVEAGSLVTDDDHVNVPAFYGRSLGGQNDWAFQTVAQPGLGGRSLAWPRGKIMGGTSALNFMTWVRASREDYDAWESLGNPGWGWDSLLPFFKRAETFHTPSKDLAAIVDVRHDQNSLGTDGPIQLSYNIDYSASHALWHQTLNAAGVSTNTTHTAGSNVGVFTNINSVDPRTAARSYSINYLNQDGKDLANLHILTGADVKRVDLQNEAGNCRASGVVFECEGQEYIAQASREIIVSGGSVSSPRILELSGVGNPSVLKRANVPVVVESPCVGENLQDHLMLAAIFEVDSTLDNPDDLLLDADYAKRAQKEYNDNQSGPLTVLPCSLSYVPFSTFTDEPTLSHMQEKARYGTAYNTEKAAITSGRLTAGTNLGQMEYLFDLGNWSTTFKSEKGKKYGTMLQILQYPFSVGSVHISPATKAKGESGVDIDPGYYRGSHGELDIDAMVAGASFLDKITTTDPLAKIIRRPVAPTKEVLQDKTKMRDWVVANTITDWHPVGTCGMGGHAGIKGGVVNERLQVYGVSNLRVIDASVMPLQISAHIQATVYAIAEKGAHMVLEDLDRSA